MWGCMGSMCSGVMLRGRANERREEEEEEEEEEEDKEENGEAEDAGGGEDARSRDEGVARGQAPFLDRRVWDCCCSSSWRCTCPHTLCS